MVAMGIDKQRCALCARRRPLEAYCQKPGAPAATAYRRMLDGLRPAGCDFQRMLNNSEGDSTSASSSIDAMLCERRCRRPGVAYFR